MDDLSGLSWDAIPPSNSNGQNSRIASQYAAMKPPMQPAPRGPSPLSGRSTPGSASLPSTKPTTQDSFAALLAPNGGKKANGLTLAEKQKQLQDEKAKQAQQRDPFKAHDATFWEGFGSGSGTPAQISQPVSRSQSTKPSEDVDDILAAFNSAAPVDASSYYPPPQNGSSSDFSSRAQSQQRSTADPRSRTQSKAAHEQSLLADDDDDPFGLAEFSKRQAPARNTPPIIQNDDDDILGMLGKPVEQVKRAPAREQRRAPQGRDDDLFGDLGDAPNAGSTHPQAKAVAELVEMGFPEDKARRALEQTETGLDTQAAISWILTQAHEEAKSKSKAKELSAEDGSYSQQSRRGEDRSGEDDAGPAWLRQPTRPDRADSRSPNAGERDVAQYASQISGTIFKSATTLWKTGQKKAQKALAEYQQRDSTGDANQPKWMRDAELRTEEVSRPARGRQEDNVTDEAMMLEPGRAPPTRRPEPRRTFEDEEVLPQRPPRQSRVEEPPRQMPSRPISRPVEKLSRQAIEEESSQAYVSPARRRTPVPAQQPPTPKASTGDASLDIFSDMPAPAPRQTTASLPRPSPTSKQSIPTPVRPRATARSMPAVSPTALATSTKQRQLGSEAFKRGDYGEATSCYSAALSPLPPSHPITIILHCNRALTQIKTGDAKAAIVDADAALALIGPARGEEESISLGAGEPEKPMKEFYGKALMRKAEAFEHLEKWTDAAAAWRAAVEAGVGASVSIAGRNRCEKAAGGSASSAPTSRPVPKKTPAARPPPKKPTSAASLLAGQQSSEAVSRLRATNAAAEQASDEAFALTDSVTSRIDGWKGGKEGNLRALLASLDTVLWAGANWTKVGMGDLVLTNKVKIVYMKAIARVHPDKLAQDATTEQKMVSASVFAALNEAWDKFKRDNNM